MPQERYNAEWVKKQGLGLAIGSFSDIADAVESLLRGARLTRFRRNAQRLDNRAVYEIPALLERIMAERLY
jgi:1,2-diacylglycerol 3-beta-galactosyltransferase